MAFAIPLSIPPKARKPLIIAGSVIGGLLALLILAVLIIPNLIPQEVYRAEIEKAAREATGRNVSVTGNISVAVFPRIEARAGASSISNPEGFGDAPFATMKELRAAVALWPLIFGGNVEIEEFVMVEPDIRLVNLADGTNNWTFDVGGGGEAAPAETPQEPGGKLSASLRDLRIEKGRVSWDDQQEGRIQTLSDLELSADMQAMDKPLSFNAKGLANDLAFKLTARLDNPQAMLDGNPSPATIQLETDLIKADLKGTLGLGATPRFDFEAKGDIPSLVELAEAFKVTAIPARDVLGKLSLEGQAFGTPDDITIKIGKARHESPLLTADLKGETRIAGGVALQLDAEAEAPKLAELARAMGIAAPAEAALGKASLAGTISGQLDNLSFENVQFSHDSGLLKLDFAGAAALKDSLTYSGKVAIAAPDLRKLAAAAGTQLPAGDIYKAFSLEGETSGSATDVLLKNANLTFDAVTATGEAALRFDGKPKLVGSLTTNSIDITPYATASGAPTEPGPATVGWGKTPIDLSPLKLVDADITLKAGGLRFDTFDFGASTVAVALANGLLTADVKQTSLFGGKGSAQLVADGSKAAPAIAFSANMEGLGLKKLLTAAAGFGSLDGSGDIVIDVAGSGADLQTLMNSLVGNGQFLFDKGTLTGVDLMALGEAAKSALNKREVKGGAISPLAQTKFETLKTSFVMTDGVAMVTGLNIDAPGFTLSGGGALDIGKQQASLNLFPQYKDKSSGLNGYGLPLELAGSWNGIKLSLDWDWLKDKASAALRDRAQAEIKDEVQKVTDDLAARLGLGKPKPAATPTPAPAEPETPAAPDQPANGETPPAAEPAAPAPSQPPAANAEDRLKAEAQKALDRLLGRD